MKHLLYFILLIFSFSVAGASEILEIEIKLKDGELIPRVIEVPIKTKVRLKLHNIGKTPAEFESNSLKKEKVLAPGVKSSMIIRITSPGEYDMFDEWHPENPKSTGKIIAK